MHGLGITQLMPRRIPDYPDALSGWNYISSIGSIISVVASILFLYIVYDLFTNLSNNTNNFSNTNYINSNSDMNINALNKNPWTMPAFFVSRNIEISYPLSGSTLEYVVSSPIPTHVYNNTPLLGENNSQKLLLTSNQLTK